MEDHPAQNRLSTLTYHLIAKAFLVNLLLILSFNLSINASGLEPEPIEIKYIRVTNAEFKISWISDALEVGLVNYGTTASLGNVAYHKRGKNTSSYTHHIKIADLTPGILYYYDIVSGNTIYNNDGAHYTIETKAENYSDNFKFSEDYKNTLLGKRAPKEKAFIRASQTTKNTSSVSTRQSSLTSTQEISNQSTPSGNTTGTQAITIYSTDCTMRQVSSSSNQGTLFSQNSSYPAASNITTTGQSREVLISYDLEFSQGTPCSILVEYSGGSAGTNWRQATVTGETAELIPQAGLSITWDSFADERDQRAFDYKIRITPYDAQQVPGASSESEIFELDNIIYTFDIPFHPGWNLITIPLVPLVEHTAESLMQEINIQGGLIATTLVMEWDGSGWEVHGLGLPFGDYAIKMGTGYFLHANKFFTWSMRGTKVIPPSELKLSYGWNGKTLPINQCYTAESLMQEINRQGGFTTVIMRWDGSGWEVHGLGLPFGDFPIEQGQGYFFYSNRRATYEIDSILPTVESFQVADLDTGNSEYTDSTAVSVSITENTPGGAITKWLINESETQPQADDPGWLTTRPTTYIIQGAEGQRIIYAWVMDENGNISTLSISSQTTITLLDTTPPSSPIINPLTSPTNQTTQTITGTKSSDTAEVILTCPTATAGTATYPTQTSWSCTLSNLDEGINQITVTARDASNNCSNATSDFIIVDTVPPRVSPFANVIDEKNVEITFSEEIAGGVISDNYSIAPNLGNLTVAHQEGNVYRIYTSEKQEDGVTYSIVTNGVTDLAGNAPDSRFNTVSFFGKTLGYLNPVTAMIGEGEGDLFGCSTSSAGDVNGDGYGDMIVGASCAGSTGKIYIYFGGPSMNDIVDITICGEGATDYFGCSASSAGDVNRDGFDDIIVGAYKNDDNGNNSGKAYIYFGGPSMDNVADVTMRGETAEDRFGYSVSSAGDVNEDGFDDVIVGAYQNDDNETNSGKAYIYFGGSSMDNVADVTMHGEATYNHFGISVSSAGDVNGDGYGDVLVGAELMTCVGKAYVYFGGPSMDNTADVVMLGELSEHSANGRFGEAISSAGDVNGDGYGDIIIGAYNTHFNGYESGKVYIYFGGTSMDNTADVTLYGETSYDHFGKSVSSLGDINGDGYEEVVIGACAADFNGTDSGKIYVYNYPGIQDTEKPQLNTEAIAINKRSIEIKYNKPVIGATNSDNYSIDPALGTISIRDLGENTYRLTTSSPQSNSVLYVITASNITDSTGNLIDSTYNQAIFKGYNNPPIVESFSASNIDTGSTMYTNSTTIAIDMTESDIDGRVVKWLLNESSVQPEPNDFSLISRPATYTLSEGDGQKTIYAWAMDNDEGINPLTGNSQATIRLDRTAPTLNSTATVADSTHIVISYSETVIGATDVSNYSADNNLVITEITYQGSNAYKLTTSFQNPGRTYTITVSNVTDLAGNAINAIHRTTTFTGKRISLITSMTGEFSYDRFGNSVASAGDVNGDGYEDIIVGGYGNNSNGPDSGKAYIYFGGPSIDDIADIAMCGEAANDWLGYSVSSAGDVNGDGFDDVIIGAYQNDDNGSNSGKAYLYFGGSSMDDVADVTMQGEAAEDRFGYSVSSAGDVNNDGFDDVVIGAHRNDSNGTDSGKAYIYFGGPSMDNISDVTMHGVASGYRFGSSVSAAGDVNGDGYADVIVGAGGRSRAYIYLGGSSMDSVSDVIMYGGSSGNCFGSSVSSAGDINGDTYADVIVGAYGNSANGMFSCKAYIYFGGPSMNYTADVTMCGEAAGDYFGCSVSSAGDMNGDTYVDVIVGAGGNDSAGIDSGKAYIYFGGPSMNNMADATMCGEAAGDYFGWSLFSAGDVNGDGNSEVIIGAFKNDDNGTYSGRTYLYSYLRILNSLPVVNTFNVSDTDTENTLYTNSATVAVSMTDSDADGTVEKWLINESSIRPEVDDFSLISRPTTYTLTEGNGEKTIYAWVIDDANGISHLTANSQATITLDTSSPTTPVVTDDGDTTSSLTALQAVWSSQDDISGIAEYKYAIGTTAGGTDVVSWTSTGLENRVAKDALVLSVGKTYYFTVMAKNRAGDWSQAGNSNGITVNQHPPNIINVNPSDGTTYIEGITSILITITAQDEDGDSLQYQFSIDGEIKQSWTVSPSHNWTITQNDTGVHTITAEVRDGNAGTDSQEVDICIFLSAINPPEHL